MRIRHTVIGMAGLLVAACSDAEAPASGYRVEVVQAPDSGVLASRLSSAIVVRITDDAGVPREGVPLTWSTPDGGTVQVSSATTSLNGLAAGEWTLGPEEGAQRLRIAALGEPATEVTVQAVGWKADDIDAGDQLGCSITDARLWCWGNLQSIIGPPNDADTLRTPVLLFPGTVPTALAVANGSVCVLDGQGIARCRGRQFVRAPGLEGSTVPDLPPLLRMAAGDYWYCGIARSDRTPWCWQDDDNDSRGRHVSTTLQLDSISVGYFETCGLDSDGAAWCWFEVGVPAPVPGLLRFRSISAGYFMTCGIVPPADLYCWGDLDRIIPGTRVTEPRLLRRGVADVSVGSVGLMSSGFGGGFVWITPVAQEFRSMPVLGRQVVTQVSADDSYCLRTASRIAYCDVTVPQRGQGPSINLQPVAPPGF